MTTANPDHAKCLRIVTRRVNRTVGDEDLTEDEVMCILELEGWESVYPDEVEEAVMTVLQHEE